MNALEIYRELSEVSHRIPMGIRKGNHVCIKTAINEVNRVFMDAFTDESPRMLLPAINSMVEVYRTVTNNHTRVEPVMHPSQRKLIEAVSRMASKLPDNQNAIYMRKEVGCLKVLVNQLLEYYYNDLAINYYSIDYYKHFSEIYRLLGFSADGKSYPPDKLDKLDKVEGKHK